LRCIREGLLVETIVDEFLSADLGDERLNKRVKSLAHTLASKPNESIPAAADSRADWEAAYRFFDNDRVTPEKVLQPHRDVTLERIAQVPSVVLVQDTTQVNLTRPTLQVQGAGNLGSDNQRGVFYHPLMAFTERSLALGTVWQKHWTRDEPPSRLPKGEKAKVRRELPIEQKESIRWVEGIRASAEVAQRCSQTQCIAVADSESDIYEVLAECTGQNLTNFQFIIRAGQERTTQQKTDWLEVVRRTPCLSRSQVKVSRRRAKFRSKANSKREGDRDARTAELEIRATNVTLKAPWRHDRQLPTVEVNLVLCEEVSPPDGAEPVIWLLVTQLPIDSIDQIRRVIDVYCIRWQIEIFFRTLKSGCRIERRRFQQLPRSMNAIALYSVIAWRILYLTQLGRSCPDLNCEVVFDPSEWKAVYTVLHHKRSDFRLPDEPPRLGEMIKMIASLGGYIDRPRQNSRPGTQTLWIGLQQTHSLSTGWLAFGPEARNFAPT
jgi:hypothetical protein